MKKIKLLTSILSISALSSGLLPLVGCSNNNSINNIELSQEVKDLKITVKSANISKGNESNFTLSLPDGKEIKAIKITIGSSTLYISDVTVEGSKVTISADKMIDSKIVVNSVGFEEPAVSKVTLDKNELTKDVNAQITESDVTVTLEYTDGSLKQNAKWNSDYKVYAVVDSTGTEQEIELPFNILEAYAAKTLSCKIKSVKDETKYADLAIKVNPILVTSVEIKSDKTWLDIGETIKLSASVLPENATNKELTWEITEGKDYAELDESLNLKGIAAGTVKVTAKAKDTSDVSNTKEFKVLPEAEINLSATNLKLAINGTAELTATVTPEEKQNDVTWESSDPNILTISQEKGKTITLTAKALGTANVTAKVGDKSAVCTVNVKSLFTETTWPDLVKAVNTWYSADKSDDEKLVAAMKALCNNFLDVNYIETIDPAITDKNLKIEAHLANFIGKTHSIWLNSNENHSVRIVGINHDDLTDGSGKALFTFDCVTPICTKSGVGLKIHYLKNDSTTVKYLESQIFINTNNYNDEVETNWSAALGEVYYNYSIYIHLWYYFTNILEMDDPIKQVKKTVLNAESTSAGLTQTQYDCYSFPLTITELNIKDSEQSVTAGSAYKYYQINTGADARIKYQAKADSPSALQYWTNSPKIVNGKFQYACIDKDGSVTYEPGYISDYRHTNCVSFAFCI